ncbi:MAG: dTMP kinase [Longimicrobiales bacterium]
MSEAGQFIVLEGVEGTGKSTQVRRLSADLRLRGIEVVESREPGGTEVGERIRDLVLHSKQTPMPAETELLLILAARAAFVNQVVRPSLARGAWVVADRFDLSTFAYQGYGRGIDQDVIASANRVAIGDLSPALYLILDLPVEEGIARQVRQGKRADRIESEGADFLGRVREGYVELARTTPSALLVPASGTADEVEGRIQSAMRDRFPETYSAAGV